MKIHSLLLFTNKVSELFEFYSKTLGIPAKRSENGFSLLIKNGDRIDFQKSDRPWYYHFAFNIAENQIEESLDFVKTFSAPIPGPETGNEIINFPAWNAHSVYFKDPANNIVEFIARHDIPNSIANDFSIDSIFEISEIGTPCLDVRTTFNLLQNALQVNRYSGNFESFCATGDMHGLFILTKMDRNWFPTQLESAAAPYQIVVESPLSGKKTFEYSDGILRLIVP